jgi:hypothetical protein
LTSAEKAQEQNPAQESEFSKYITAPPLMGGTLTANSVSEASSETQETSSDPMSNPLPASFLSPNIYANQKIKKHSDLQPESLVRPTQYPKHTAIEPKPEASLPQEPVTNDDNLKDLIEKKSPITTSTATPAQFNVDALYSKPLGPVVDEDDTLEDIESSVKEYSDIQAYEPEPSALDQEAARKAVFEATSGFDANRPGALESSGANAYIPLGSEPSYENETKTIDYEDDEIEPPTAPPPLPIPPNNGTMPLPQ